MRPFAYVRADSADRAIAASTPGAASSPAAPPFSI